MGKLEGSNHCRFERAFVAHPALRADCPCPADVDECLTGQALCVHQCLNTRGSFKCTCNPGYELGADGKQCYREYQRLGAGTGGGFAAADECLCAVLCDLVGPSADF